MNIRPATSCVTLLGLLGVVLSGCGQGETRPDDLPPLTSCVVDVVYNGSPVSDATITMVPASGRWVGVGKTDANGHAVVQTQGRYQGVPAGSYTVTVTKYDPQQELPPDPTSPEEDAQLGQALSQPVKRKALVPEKYLKPDTSDLQITVEDSPIEKKLELKDG